MSQKCSMQATNQTKMSKEDFSNNNKELNCIIKSKIAVLQKTTKEVHKCLYLM